MNTSEILTRAGDLIEERGHWKGWYCGPNGELCIRGAIFAATGIEPKERDDFAWIEETIHADAAELAEAFAHRAAPGHNIVAFNDAADTTAVEVCNVLRGAAEAARAEQ